LNMTENEVYRELDRAYNDLAILKRCYPDELTKEIKEQLLLLPGVGIDDGNYGTLRDYPQKESLAHFIGYTGAIASQEELIELTGSANGNERYNTDSHVGKTGIEKLYEDQLRGHDGYFIYICAKDGTNKETLYRKNAQNGQDVHLTIDGELQQRLDEVMHCTLVEGITAGAVVALNPYTGAIDAMGSYPSYDINNFARGWSEADWQQIQNNAMSPLFNRLIQGRYPPGSICKPFTAVAALETGARDTDDVFVGEIDDDKWIPGDDGQGGPWKWSAITRVEINNRHTPLNMHNAMVDSDNIYFADAALKIGADTLVRCFEKYGFDAAIDFDLNVASPQIRNEDTLELSPVLLADSGYGQGELLITPLQIASMYTAFANGSGDIIAPHMVEGLYQNDGLDYRPETQTQKKTWREDVIKTGTVSTIEPMLRDVVADGTGYQLKVRSVEVSGKTGTAEIGNDKSREISWFVGYRTGVSPEDARLVLVMLEIPATKDFTSLKFDIARELLKMPAQSAG